jgi:hypothetical protein
MSNKTCGECCGFSESENRCTLLGGRGKAYSDNEACRRFSEKKPIPPPTNGDWLRQLSNGAFAFMMTRLILDGCPVGKSKTLQGCKISNDCTTCLKKWLNDPACVKQNGNHDTQTDLCQTDNTESEKENPNKNERNER